MKQNGSIVVETRDNAQVVDECTIMTIIDLAKTLLSRIALQRLF